MIRLNLKKEPFDLTLGLGVKVTVRPINTAIMRAADLHARKAVADKLEERLAQPVDEREDLTLDLTQEGISQAEYIKAIARQVITGWEGVGDENGETAAVTPEAVDALMDLYPFGQNFFIQYVATADELIFAKKDSKPEAAGTSGKEQATAGNAASKTSRARKAKKV